MDEFGKRLAIIRKEKKMSQAELAKRLDMARTSITQWESGARVPSLSALDQLAKILDVSVDYLMGNEMTEEQLVVEKINHAVPIDKIAEEHDFSYRGHVLNEDEKKWLLSFLDTALKMKNSVKKE